MEPSNFERHPRSKFRAVIAVALAAGLVTAGFGYALWSRTKENRGDSAQSRVTSGLTAFHLVQDALTKESPRGWLLFSDLGIESNSPYTPLDLTQNGSNPYALEAIWACGSLPTPSIWNLSGLPDRSGNLSDGLAPFWQFMFANLSGPGQLVFAIGTYVSGQVHVFAPLSDSNACIEDLGLSEWTSLPPASVPNLDTNLGGPLAYSAQSDFIAQLGKHALIWTDGTVFFDNAGAGSGFYNFGIGWHAEFYACGEAGVAPPPQSLIVALETVYSNNGTPSTGLALTVTGNCTEPSYNISTTYTGTSSLGTGSSAVVLLNVSFENRGTRFSDGQGLAAWMVQPQVRSSPGAIGMPLPLAKSSCPAWTSNPGICLTPEAGWYGVLLSPGGTWLDSYGMENGTAGWAAPNVPIVSNESFVILSSMPLSGAVCELYPTVGTPPILTSPVVL